MKMNGAAQNELIEDLAAALAEFLEPFERDPALWKMSRPGKWSAGQHAEHLALTLATTADALERAEAELRRGTLARRPWRGPLQAIFVAVAVRAGRFPRGGRTPRAYLPDPACEWQDVRRRLAADLERHRALGARLTEAERDRLWIGNPFMKGWHYSYPEILRVHAVHLRHHASLVAEGVG